jgi:hypothetical protein
MMMQVATSLSPTGGATLLDGEIIKAAGKGKGFGASEVGGPLWGRRCRGRFPSWVVTLCRVSCRRAGR